MKRAWYIIISSFVALLVIIQFFQPEKNNSMANPEHDIVFQLDMPASVKKTIVNACYDCHSNMTHYPFYGKVAPASWLLAKHIREGKEQLNFSEWAGYNKREQIKLLTSICDEISSDDMPIKGYVFMHNKAVINEKQKEEICQWTEEAAGQVMTSKD